MRNSCTQRPRLEFGQTPPQRTSIEERWRMFICVTTAVTVAVTCPMFNCLKHTPSDLFGVGVCYVNRLARVINALADKLRK